MGYFVADQSEQKLPSPSAVHDAVHDLDSYWQLTQRIVAGPHFARSPLLSKFLLFVVSETLEGRGGEITEHQIGVQVFDRPSDYRTVEDNIVRNYARQLRKRLAEHFAREGRAELLRIDIPVGGYVPAFFPATGEAEREEDAGPAVPSGAVLSGMAPSLLPEPVGNPEAATASLFRGIGKLQAALLIAAYSAVLICATWFVASRVDAPKLPKEPAQALWSALFGGPGTSYIVPSDAGFNLVEDLSGQPIPLAEYIAGDYDKVPLAGVDGHSAEDLRTQQLTPFVDLQIAASLARLAKDNQQRVDIRFPRDFRLDDLKRTNAVIIGSLGSNPWAAMVESSANFRIAYHPGMRGSEIINKSPQPGEARTYISHWNEPSHESFALIEFLPNLSGNGHLLVLEGLDVAGTQAAAEMLLQPSAIDPILKSATRPDGTLRNFEVLLRSTSIDANATRNEVIASRIY
jgi:hypothetical protein